ncbi:hypothetical protein SDC9_83077 [bioreactor metagenome]|uniref:Uncharacterized protein n=1 Tax=bioreactor metagenome TaxID=1076179 RepID=A0A644Z771_9ZZZZ
MGKKSNDERPLNERHLLLAELLVSGTSISDAASTVGLSRQRVSDLIRKSPNFKAELEARRYEALLEIRDKMREAVVTAADETVKLLRDEEISPAARLQVAVSLLGRLEKYFTSDTREPRDAEKIAADMSRMDPFSGIIEVSEPMKNFLLEKDLAELRQDHKQGAA